MNWELFKDNFLRAQEPPSSEIKQRREEQRTGREQAGTEVAEQRPPGQTEGYKEKWWQRKQGRTAQEEYRVTAWTCTERIRKAKVHMKMNLAMDMENSKKDFFRCIGQKRQEKNNVAPLIKGEGRTGLNRQEKVKIFRESLASNFIGAQAYHSFHISFSILSVLNDIKKNCRQ